MNASELADYWALVTKEICAKHGVAAASIAREDKGHSFLIAGIEVANLRLEKDSVYAFVVLPPGSRETFKSYSIPIANILGAAQIVLPDLVARHSPHFDELLIFHGMGRKFGPKNA